MPPIPTTCRSTRSTTTPTPFWPRRSPPCRASRRSSSRASRTSPSGCRPTPAALAARKISLEEVRAAIAGATVNQAKGNLENEHQSITLDTNDQLFHAAAYRNIIVAYRNGAPVKLEDVSRVIDA